MSADLLASEAKGYGALVLLGILLVAGAALFFGGCHEQKKRDAATLALVTGQRDDSYRSLAASAKALKAVNDQARANLALAKAAADDAKAAGLRAVIAEQRAAASAAAFHARKDTAAKRPACAALLNADVGAICALSSP